MCQVTHNQWQQALNKVKELRDDFISKNPIKKIIDENIIITPVTGNQVNYVIKLTYY